MDIIRKASTTAALTVAGAGLAIGGIGLASAEDATTGQSSQTAAAQAERGDHRHGPADRARLKRLVAGLSEQLDIPKSEVRAALQAVREQLEPPTRGEGEREERRAEFVAALAAELGVTEQELTDALDAMAEERTATARAALSERLDAAVADGTLTEADKESVLKAFDAGVLGGDRRGPGGPAVGAPEGTSNS